MPTPTLVPPPPQLLTIEEVAKRYCVSPSTVWRWEALGKLPRGIRLTSGTVRWRAEEIDNHVAALTAR